MHTLTQGCTRLHCCFAAQRCGQRQRQRRFSRCTCQPGIGRCLLFVRTAFFGQQVRVYLRRMRSLYTSPALNMGCVSSWLTNTMTSWLWLTRTPSNLNLLTLWFKWSTLTSTTCTLALAPLTPLRRLSHCSQSNRPRL